MNPIINQIEVTGLIHDAVHLNLRIETQGHPPSFDQLQQYMGQLEPSLTCLSVIYNCDVCHKQFEIPDTLTNHQCAMCNHYFDTCPDCQPPTDGCYLCQSPTTIEQPPINGGSNVE